MQQSASVGGWTGAAFGHEGCFFGSDAELAARSLPFVEEGLDLGQPVVVVASRTTIELLRHRFGSHVDRFEVCQPADRWWEGNAHLTAMSYARAMRRLIEEAAPWRVVSEPTWLGTDRRRVWCRLEAAQNHFFAALPAYQLCLHDTRTVGGVALDDAVAAHPLMCSEHGPVSAAGFRDPMAFVRSIETPVHRPPIGAIESLSARDARRVVAGVAGSGGFAERLDDIELVVAELMSNAIHAAPHVAVSAWCEDGSLWCQVSDDGPGFDLGLSGYGPPLPEAASGRGLWIVRTLCDDLAIESSPNGTIAQARFDPRP